MTIVKRPGKYYYQVESYSDKATSCYHDGEQLPAFYDKREAIAFCGQLMYSAGVCRYFITSSKWEMSAGVVFRNAIANKRREATWCEWGLDRLL